MSLVTPTAHGRDGPWAPPVQEFWLAVWKTAALGRALPIRSLQIGIYSRIWGFVRPLRDSCAPRRSRWARASPAAARAMSGAALSPGAVGWGGQGCVTSPPCAPPAPCIPSTQGGGRDPRPVPARLGTERDPSASPGPPAPCWGPDRGSGERCLQSPPSAPLHPPPTRTRPPQHPGPSRPWGGRGGRRRSPDPGDPGTAASSSLTEPLGQKP